MINLDIKISPDISKLTNAYNNPGIKEFIQMEVQRFAFTAQSFAKQITPVATGRLRSSIGVSSKMQGLGAIVATNVNYAVFVHEGTRKMRGRPFMERGAEFAKANWEGQIGRRLDTELRKRLTAL